MGIVFFLSSMVWRMLDVEFTLLSLRRPIQNEVPNTIKDFAPQILSTRFG
jgi:hypothetical protein